MHSRKLILWYSVFFFLIFFLVYIFWYTVLPGFLGALLLYSSISFVIHRAYATVRWKHKKYYSEYFIIFIYKFSLLTLFVILWLSYFIYHQSYLFPAQMPRHTLTNGEQTIIFQNMSHIGSESFYVNVRDNLKKKKQEGYVLYYEWVRPGSEENKKAFDMALWIKLESDTYSSLARLYGVVAQDNNMFLWLWSTPDINVDISIDEIMSIYNKRPEKTGVWENKWLLNSREAYDAQELVLDKLDNISSAQLFVIKSFNVAFLNFMIKHSFLRDGAIKLMWNEDIFSVILDDRNEHVANYIITNNEEKIIILYWLMHFEWILSLLQSHDSRWSIVSTENQQIIVPDVSINMLR